MEDQKTIVAEEAVSLPDAPSDDIVPDDAIPEAAEPAAEGDMLTTTEE